MKFQKVKFGVLGCSRVAQKGMLPAICDSNFGQLAIVGSRSLEKASLIAKQFDCDSFGSYEDVLKSDNVDVVYISLPNALHEEWAIKALEEGKHVLCEKPAALSYVSAKKMVEVAKKNGVRLLEGLMFRYHPQHSQAKELIKNGFLGELLKFDGCFSYPSPGEESSLVKDQVGGGSFYACAPYPVYASRMFFNEEPVSIFCKLTINSLSGVDEKTDMLLQYSNGKSAFIFSAFGSYFQSTYSVLGSKAYLKVARAYAVPRDMKTKIFLDSDDKITEKVIEPADHFRLMVDDFCEEILKGEASGKNYEEDLLAQARVLQAARISDAEKRIVNISEIK